MKEQKQKEVLAYCKICGTDKRFVKVLDNKTDWVCGSCRFRTGRLN